MKPTVESFDDLTKSEDVGVILQLILLLGNNYWYILFVVSRMPVIGYYYTIL